MKCIFLKFNLSEDENLKNIFISSCVDSSKDHFGGKCCLINLKKIQVTFQQTYPFCLLFLNLKGLFAELRRVTVAVKEE